MNLLFSCKEMSFLVSRELDVKLTFFTRFRMWMHLVMCKNCTTYRDQIRVVDQFLKNEALDRNENAILETLSPESKERIIEQLRFSQS